MFTPEHVALENSELCAPPLAVTDLDSNTKFAAGSECRRNPITTWIVWRCQSIFVSKAPISLTNTSTNQANLSLVNSQCPVDVLLIFGNLTLKVESVPTCVGYLEVLVVTCSDTCTSFIVDFLDLTSS